MTLMDDNEAEYAANVDAERDNVVAALTEARHALMRVEKATARLDDGPAGSGALYDVEYADGGGPAIVATALATARMSLAAIENVVPSREF